MQILESYAIAAINDFVTLFQLHAENSYTQQKVSILFKDAAIEEVIKAVEAQSGYVVVYNNTLLNCKTGYRDFTGCECRGGFE